MQKAQWGDPVLFGNRGLGRKVSSGQNVLERILIIIMHSYKGCNCPWKELGSLDDFHVLLLRLNILSRKTHPVSET